jgi:broad specificity phosphatase PhoE
MAAEKTQLLPRLFLIRHIRHGNTDWSDSGKHTGRMEFPLNACGEAHARLLGTRLLGERFL